LLDRLVEALSDLAVSTDPKRLHLDAACIESSGVGVVVTSAPGDPTGALMVELLRLGGDHLSDVCTTFLPGSRTVFGHPAPLTIDPLSYEMLSATVDPRELPPRSDRSRAHVRASISGRRSVPYTTVGVVVLSRFSREDAPVTRRLPPHEACARLLAECGDCERFGPASLDVLAALLAGVSCWEVVYRDTTVAARSILALEPARERQLTALHQFESDVRVARMGSGGVLIDGLTGVQVLLDPAEVDALESLLVRGVTLGSEDEMLRRLAEAGVQPPRVGTRRPVPGVESFGLPNCPSGEAARVMWDDESSARRRVRAIAAGGDGAAAVGPVAQAVLRERVSVSGEEQSAVADRHHAARAEVTRIESVLRDVLERAESVGVVPLVLGDPVHAHDGVLPVDFTDAERVDLLVDRPELPRVTRALGAAGYRVTPLEPAPSPAEAADDAPHIPDHVILTAPSGSDSAGTVTVKLHSSLAVGPFGELVPPEELHERSVPFRLGDRWCRALHPEDRFVLTCVLVDQDPAHSSIQDLRDVVLTAPRAEALMQEAMEAAERWAATRSVIRTIRRVDAEMPGIPPWLVDLSRRESEDVRRRRSRRSR
jgi:hypothetical protein